VDYAGYKTPSLATADSQALEPKRKSATRHRVDYGFPRASAFKAPRPLRARRLAPPRKVGHTTGVANREHDLGPVGIGRGP
jgi:hypothetical protein